MNDEQKNKRLKLILPVLCVIAVVVWLPGFQQNERTTKVRKQIQAEITPELNALLLTVSTDIQPEIRERSKYVSWDRNPFFPQGWTRVKEITPEAVEEEIVAIREPFVEQTFVLNGIFWNPHKPSALINDEVVGIGAKIGKYEIVDIARDRVIAFDGTNKIDFKMWE